MNFASDASAKLCIQTITGNNPLINAGARPQPAVNSSSVAKN
jgi:hypothetical protein